ncbi:MAG: cytochrome c class [Segetibacter sp.]|nr:cytochrome c class [Segetibacter sp.]
MHRYTSLLDGRVVYGVYRYKLKVYILNRLFVLLYKFNCELYQRKVEHPLNQRRIFNSNRKHLSNHMKKASILFFSLLIGGFGNYYSFSQTKQPAKKTTTKTVTTKTTTSGNNNASKADIEAGKNLISKSDCLACHQLKVKVVGPAYSAVAAKYPATDANIDKLAGKIIKGGAGAWGQIPMSPHPQIAEADAKKMVKYILSLKGK